jgi:hypothetical protein
MNTPTPKNARLRSYVLILTWIILAIHTFTLVVLSVTSLHLPVTAESPGPLTFIQLVLSLIFRVVLLRVLYKKHARSVRILVNVNVFLFVAHAIYVGVGMTLFHVLNEEGHDNKLATAGAVVMGIVELLAHGLIYILPLWRYKKALTKEALVADLDLEAEALVDDGDKYGAVL